VKAALIVLIALLTACCGHVSVKTHAQVASASADLLTGIGAAIDAERLADLEAARAQVQPGDADSIEERREETLVVQFEPVMSAYEAAQAALLDYTTAIATAIAQGKSVLASNKAAALLAAWKSLNDIGEALGVQVPDPVTKLEQLAKEPQK
jgi:homoserine dehydrogenase